MPSRYATIGKVFGLAAACWALLGGIQGAAAAQLIADVNFGAGDGWRAPFEVISGDAAGTDTDGLYRFLGNGLSDLAVNPGNTERGLAYNPTTNNLILVSRGSGDDRIRILDGATGVDKGSLDMTGVTGGNFAMNMVGVADDGAIYMANLSTNMTTSPYKIYRWENESAIPTVAFSGMDATAPLNGARLGDSFDVIGSGAATKFVAGYGTSSTIAGTNGFAMFSTTDGLNYTSTSVTPTATSPLVTPASGAFRLGITFVDADTVIGKSDTNAASIVDVAGTAGTVTTQFATDGIVLRPMDYAVVGGRPLVAMVEASNGQNETSRARIFVYDMTDPSLPLADRKIGEASALPFTVGGPNQFINGNSVGQVKFGAISGSTATIYSMSTNNGIQAFTLTFDPVVPPVANADFNGDLVVDGNDFLIWQRGNGLSAQSDNTTGDADGDGNVNDADLAIWKELFGTIITPPAPASAIPEPAGLALAAVGLVCLAARRRNV